MKESYSEGVATHTGPESCVAIQEDEDEALTRERAGRVWSRERELTSERRRHRARRKARSAVSIGETRQSSARSETPGMYGNIPSGNREIPLLSREKRWLDRIEKSKDERR